MLEWSCGLCRREASTSVCSRKKLRKKTGSNSFEPIGMFGARESRPIAPRSSVAPPDGLFRRRLGSAAGVMADDSPARTKMVVNDVTGRQPGGRQSTSAPANVNRPSRPKKATAPGTFPPIRRGINRQDAKLLMRPSQPHGFQTLARWIGPALRTDGTRERGI